MSQTFKKAEIICVGTELLSGRINTYIPLFASGLKEAGFVVEREHSVRDRVKDISETVAGALRRANAIIICGGLGPTFDDLTREGVAKTLKRKLGTSKKQLEILKRKFRKYRFPMPKMNERQAMLIEKASVIANSVGSAPGQLIKLKNPVRLLALLPGPLDEWKPMFENFILPELKKTFPVKTVKKTMVLRVAGMSESAVEEALRPVLEKTSGLDFTILAGMGTVDFFATVNEADAGKCAKKLKQVRAECENLLGNTVYGGHHDSLESVIGKKLSQRHWTLSAAESCTGGLISHRLTEVPGSSAYFMGTVVAYSNIVKEKLLGVRASTLKKYGAVSSRGAVEMARGARKLFKTDCALAVTGIAGPSGGSKEKPVGLVFVAVSAKGMEDAWGKKVFNGPRSRVKARAACMALDLLRRRLDTPAVI